MDVTGELRFICTTPSCGFSAWVAADFDPDAGARVALLHGVRPTCPECGCRTVPDWLSGARMPLAVESS